MRQGREWPGDQGPSALGAGEKGGEEGPCGGATWPHIWGVFGTHRGLRKPGVPLQKKNSLPVGREGETGSLTGSAGREINAQKAISTFGQL